MGVYHEPLPPQPLDPSLHQLLKDTDLALLRKKKRTPRSSTKPELDFEAVEVDEEVLEGPKILDILDTEDDYDNHSTHTRLSPEAAFGSKRIGQVTLPWELEGAMTSIIESTCSQPCNTHLW